MRCHTFIWSFWACISFVNESNCLIIAGLPCFFIPANNFSPSSFSSSGSSILKLATSYSSTSSASSQNSAIANVPLQLPTTLPSSALCSPSQCTFPIANSKPSLNFPFLILIYASPAISSIFTIRRVAFPSTGITVAFRSSGSLVLTNGIQFLSSQCQEFTFFLLTFFSTVDVDVDVAVDELVFFFFPFLYR